MHAVNKHHRCPLREPVLVPCSQEGPGEGSGEGHNCFLLKGHITKACARSPRVLSG